MKNENDLTHSFTNYLEEVGGVFVRDDLQAIPFNHWLRDMEWVVLVMRHGADCALLPVTAQTAEDACELGLLLYLQTIAG